MGFLKRWLGARGEDTGLAEWHRAWSQAAARPDALAVTDLRDRLARLDAPGRDLEIEHEMLDGLEHVVGFAATVAESGLPVIATGHRVVAHDICHFTAPASMPDDPAQPSGRLLLTSARAIFVGGARGLTVAWHALAQPLQTDRDLILVRVDGTAIYRFRCNSYDDALCGAFVARRLARDIGVPGGLKDGV